MVFLLSFIILLSLLKQDEKLITEADNILHIHIAASAYYVHHTTTAACTCDKINNLPALLLTENVIACVCTHNRLVS